MKRLAVGLLALVILIGCAAVYAADTGTGESLVTQGYLNDTYIPDVLRQAETRIAEQTKTVYDSVLADLNARHSGYLPGQVENSAMPPQSRISALKGETWSACLPVPGCCSWLEAEPCPIPAAVWWILRWGRPSPPAPR